MMRPLAKILPSVVASALLAGCAPQFVAPTAGDLQSARLACDAEYPRRIGNYLPHATCVNGAVERYAVPSAHHADLIRLQEQVRSRLSEKIDRRLISPRTGEHRMREADAMVAEAERDRDAGRDGAALRRVTAIEAMLR